MFAYTLASFEETSGGLLFGIFSSDIAALVVSSIVFGAVRIAESLVESVEVVSDFIISSFAGVAVLCDLSLTRSASPVTIRTDNTLGKSCFLCSNLRKMLRCGASNLRAE